MPHGPYYTDLPQDGGGLRYVDEISWNRVVDGQATWQGDVNGGGHVLTNVVFGPDLTGQTPWTQDIDGAGYTLFNAVLGTGTTLPWTSITGKPATFPPDPHVHAAADITSGILAQARLASGTPTASTFVRGDGAWAQVDWSVIAGAPSSFPPAPHVHDAADITSGILAVARLASGAPTATKFVRGDGSWAQVDWLNLTGAPSTFPPTAHQHDTADVTTGIFATARLGSGSASASTFLRGDGTWQPSPGAVASVFGRTGVVTAQLGDYPPALLGTGTPDTTRFLRGDGTWQIPPGGAGGGQTPWMQDIDAAGYSLINAGSVTAQILKAYKANGAGLGGEVQIGNEGGSFSETTQIRFYGGGMSRAAIRQILDGTAYGVLEFRCGLDANPDNLPVFLKVATNTVTVNADLDASGNITAVGNMYVGNSSGTAGVTMHLDGFQDYLHICTSGGGGLRLMTVDVTRMEIAPDGRIGIGGAPIVSAAGKLVRFRTAADQNLCISQAVNLAGAVCLETANDAWNVNTPMEFRASQFQFNVGPATFNAQTTCAGSLWVCSVNPSPSFSGGAPAIEVRETSQVAAAQSSDSYAPRIAFHWSGRVAQQIRMNASGIVQIVDGGGSAYAPLACGSLTANADSTINGALTVAGAGKYIYCSYVNTTANDVGAGRQTYVGVQNSDSFLRWQGMAAFAAALNSATSPHTEAVGLAWCMPWKNYGTNHVIFDASQGTAPNGAAINRDNAAAAWTGSYPSLMGWNGSSTYGVRVDSCRYADSAGSVSGTGSFSTLSVSGTSTLNGTVTAAAIQHPGTFNQGLKFKASTAGNHTGVWIDSFNGYNSYLFFASGGAKWTIYNNAGGANSLYILDEDSSAGVYLNQNATTWTAASDGRFKDIISRIPNALAKVDALRGVLFTDKGDADKIRRVGLIAQDVKEVLPEAVDETNPERWGLRYTELIPLLVEAIRELKAKVALLEAQGATA